MSTLPPREVVEAALDIRGQDAASLQQILINVRTSSSTRNICGAETCVQTILYHQNLFFLVTNNKNQAKVGGCGPPSSPENRLFVGLGFCIFEAV